MKKILLLTVLVLSSHILSAQSKDELAVAEAVNKLTNALLTGEREQLNAIAAEELTYGHSSGTIEDKAAFVEALATGKTDFTKIDISNQTVSIVGNVALVRHTMSADLGNTHLNLGVLTVWTKQKNAWKLLARQAFRL